MDKGTTIVMVTHDTHMASHADRMLFLQDGALLKEEKQGTHFMKKKLMCPRCHGRIQPDDAKCPHCERKL